MATITPDSPTDTIRSIFRDVEKKQEAGVNIHAKHKYTCREKMAYMIDRGFESPRIQALLIAFILILGICAGAVLIFIGDKYVPPDDPSVPGYGAAATFGEAVWKSWTYMADPGTHADVDSNIYFRTSAFVTAIMGILLMAAIIGFVVDAIKKKMDALDTGRSRVVIKEHILIMGWTEKTIQVIDQIALMMESEGGGTIVLCSDKPKRDALDEVLERCTLLNSKIIVRTGSISSQSDLAKMAASFARAIIVLAPEGAADKADASVLRCVLSLKGLSMPLSGHVVAEMRDIDNTSLVEVVGGSSVETIVSHDVVGRLMIQAARQRGLAEVYKCVLGFEGDEIYLKKWPNLVGKTFEDVLNSFDDAIPIGVATKTSSGSMHVHLNPPGHRVIGLSEAIIVIAEDDDSYFPRETPVNIVNPDALSLPVIDNSKRKPEKILMTGWRRDIDDIIVLLDELVCAGSELHMLNELDLDERDDRLIDGGLDPSTGLINLKLIHHVGNPAVKRKLEEVSVSQFDSVLILSDEAFEEDMMHSDSHSLAILLLIRDLQLNDKDFIAKQNINILKASSKDTKSFSFKNKLSGLTRSGTSNGTPTKLKLAKILPKKLATSPSALPVVNDKVNDTGNANGTNSGKTATSEGNESKNTDEKPKPSLLSLVGQNNNNDNNNNGNILTASKTIKRLSITNSANKAKKLFRKGAVRKKADWKKDIIKSSSCIVTCEILDPTTHTMIMQNPAIAHMSDYVLSNNTVSKVLAMVAESREVKSVLKELLGSAGCDIAVFPLKRYTHTGVDVSFWDLFSQVRKRGEILIGYLLNDELFLNPKSDARLIKRSWDLNRDRLVIVTSKKTGTSRSRSSQ